MTNSKRWKGRYTGTRKLLSGETALIRRMPDENLVLAQFDSLALPLEYTHAWSPFKSSEFKIWEVGTDEPGTGATDLSVTESKLLESDPQTFERFPLGNRDNY